MNKLDDFLRSKINSASDDSPSGWDALNDALPVQTTTSIAKWAFVVLLLGGLVTTGIVKKYQTSKGHISKEEGTLEQVSASNKDAIEAVSSPLTVSKPVAVENEKTVTKTLKNHRNPVQNTKVTTSAAESNNIPPQQMELASSPTKIEPNVNTKGQEEILKADEKVAQNNEVAALPSNTEKAKDSKKIAIHKMVRSDFHQGKVYVSASFSTILSYRSFQLNDGAAPFVNKNYDQIRQNSEAMNLGGGATLALEYKLSKSISLQGALSYNKLSYKTSYNFEINDKALTDNTGRVIGYESLPNSIYISTNKSTKIEVLRIPVGINYNLFLSPTMLFHIYVGGSHNILLSASGVGVNQLSLAEQKITKADFSNTAKEICFDLGVNIAMSSKYGLGVDLYYNKWLTNISTNKLENVTPFSPGINFVISRKLF